MRRSADFGATVKYGRRATQPDIVIHARQVDRADEAGAAPVPQVGLIVTKSVGSAVQRHRVARRLRHVLRGVVDQLLPTEQVVIRALPGSSRAQSASLEAQVRTGLARIRRSGGADQ